MATLKEISSKILNKIKQILIGAVHLLGIFSEVLPRQRGKRAILLFLIVTAMFCGFLTQIILRLPDVQTISIYAPSETTEIYSADGKLLAKLHREENRTVVPLSKISPILQKAIIAMEDTRFFQHHGFDPYAILRAAIANIQRRRISEGASTLTQQLARSLFLTQERTLTRKIAELLLAVKIERHYTKEEILELYLNQIYWGHNAYGIESAANIYFGKHADELDLSEAALLTGIMEGPEVYSPYKHPELAKERQGIVLDRLAELGIIYDRDAILAKLEPLKLLPERPKTGKWEAPYFTSYVISELIKKYGEAPVYNGGLRVYTTLDTRMQRVAEEITRAFVSGEGDAYNFSQAALVSLDPRTGYIKAMVGGVSFESSEFNRAVQAHRQPGSSFKPYVYTAAMELQISPGFIIEDSPVTFEVPADEWNPEGVWEPVNFDEKFRGNVTVREALEKSLNVPSVKLLDMIGVQAAINVARKMGIESPLRRNLALTLGVSEVTLLEHTSAMGVFANSGIRVSPTAILRVEGRDGTVIEKHVIREKRALDPNVNAIMVDIMKGVLLRGTGVRGRLEREAAGKTGTSQEFKDAWFIGFVPQLVTGVWVGNDDNTPMEGVTEVAICPRMWKSYTNIVLTGVPTEEFGKPQGLVEENICLDSGLLAGSFCPPERIIKADYFWNKKPEKICDKHTGPGASSIPSSTGEVIVQ